MGIPLLDLKREYQAVAAEVRDTWTATLGEMHLLKGPQVTGFEQEIAAYIGTPYAVGVASGTDALLLGVLGLGIGAGDQVVLHANGFTADVEAIRYAGAEPVLVDVDAHGYGPDPDAVAQAITPRTKAIMAVHMYGSPLHLERLADMASAHGLALIEDASHAHGASRDGRKVGSFGRIGCFSCGIVKNLGAYGDAGFVTTADAEVVARLRLLQTHGQEKKNHHVLYGFNSRLDELQAAVLRVKLRHLETRNRRRHAIATYYSERFASLDLRTPVEGAGEVHVYHQYVVRTSQRDRLQAHLKAAGVETGVHYPVPLHRQPCFASLGYREGSFPEAEDAARTSLALPVYPELQPDQLEYVAEQIRAFYAG